MNWLKKGPELKLSELKIPDFAYDLYYDLKERHLLPLVVVLLVAMVAVPIYAKSSTKSQPEPAPRTPPIATASGASAGGESIVVARSAPGLRDYKRRLKGARALDPFEQRGQEPASPETSSAGEVAPVTETPAPATVESPPETTVIGGEASYSPPQAEGASPSEPPLPPEATGSDGTAGKPRTRYASSAIDVRIVSVPAESADAKTNAKGQQKKPEAQVRRNLPELTMLPARATPAATFMGTSRDGKKALMLISSDVVSIFGEANCVIGSQSCQLLALEPGLPETFVYGPHERTFRIEVLKIDRTLSAKPRRATLGATKHNGQGKRTGGSAESTGSEPAGRSGSEGM